MIREVSGDILLSKARAIAHGVAPNEVSPLITHHLGDLPIPIFVYTQYQADVKAQEPGLV